MKKKWWQDTVVYQLYPKSFLDTTGNGIGDLRGVIRKLDYIEKLGVNVIWLNPVNVSPMKDNGYDIADYYTIDPLFGSNEDLFELVEKAKARGIKILMDLVVNHCSSEHRWFKSLLADPQHSPYRDYFIVKRGKDGHEPNNLRSHFGEPCWERIGDTDDFYFHAFAKEQPDLNWENPVLRQEIYDMMNFWLKRGVAGFRIDAIGNIKKSEKVLSYEPFPADAEDGLAACPQYLHNQPGIEKFLGEMRDKVFAPSDCMNVAEVSVDKKDLGVFIGDKGFFSMVFDFSYTDLDVRGRGTSCTFNDWTLDELKNLIFASQEDVQKIGWAAPYLENHDQPRSPDKYLPESDINDYSKKMLGALYFFLRGTPYIYQGQELGMVNYPLTSLSELEDVAAINHYRLAVELGIPEKQVFDWLRRRGRDNARTPMQWNDTLHAGFTTGTPWLKENPNYPMLNAEAEECDPDSVLNFYRKMVHLRRDSEYKKALVYGAFEGIRTEAEEDFVYKRFTDDQEVLVVLNFSNKKRPWCVDRTGFTPILNNYQELGEEMEPYQAVLLARQR